jgi:hypothetical protein
MSRPMIRSVCSCNAWVEADTEIAICHRCGKYITTLRVTPQEEQQMRDELELLFHLVDLDLL